ncbi:MAG: hypothetical protein CMI16_07150 [Opitutaceae bacterium]|nr:hypothetical protein [Opitutaceae bacterium]
MVRAHLRRLASGAGFDVLHVRPRVRHTIEDVLRRGPQKGGTSTEAQEKALGEEDIREHMSSLVYPPDLFEKDSWDTAKDQRDAITRAVGKVIPYIWEAFAFSAEKAVWEMVEYARLYKHYLYYVVNSPAAAVLPAIPHGCDSTTTRVTEDELRSKFSEGCGRYTSPILGDELVSWDLTRVKFHNTGREENPFELLLADLSNVATAEKLKNCVLSDPTVLAADDGGWRWQQLPNDALKRCACELVVNKTAAEDAGRDGPVWMFITLNEEDGGGGEDIIRVAFGMPNRSFRGPKDVAVRIESYKRETWADVSWRVSSAQRRHEDSFCERMWDSIYAHLARST